MNWRQIKRTLRLGTLRRALVRAHLPLPRPASVSVDRLGVLVEPGMLPADDGSNINGPSLIRAPDWLDGAPGRYLLYFAHHHGTHIRMAYADRIEGPYRLYAPGTLNLDQCPACAGHVASPDVHVDHEARQIVMYFHAPSRTDGKQRTFRATSRNGIDFIPEPDPLGSFYFRVWPHGGATYALAKDRLYRSADGGRTFEPGPRIDDGARAAKIRHTAVRVAGDRLDLYFTRIGQSPESICRAHIDLSGDWRGWRIAEEELVLSPETDWEGAALPPRPSRPGAILGPENALRDPAIHEEDGQLWLLYSVMGERGIALAKIRDDRL